MAPITNAVYLKVTTLSPTHIGGAAEKHLKPKLDIFLTGDKDNREAVCLPIDVIGQVLTENWHGFNTLATNSAGYASEIKKEMDQLRPHATNVWPWGYGDEAFNTGGGSTDIKTHIKDGMGRLYIPGSSIKGALNTAIGVILDNKEYSGDSKSYPGHQFVYKPQGQNEVTELMRAIRVTDAYWSRSDLKLTKIFNLKQVNGEWEAAWKHGQNSSAVFDEKGFTTVFEVLPRNQTSMIRLDFLLLNQVQKAVAHPKYRELEPLAIGKMGYLFDAINDHTITYINREINFFMEYESTDNNTIEHLNRILEKAQATKEAKNGFILRLGGGQGYHSITGDWIFDNHITSIEDTKESLYGAIKNAGVRDTGNRTKSRKIIFNHDEEDGWDFQPMGFLHFEIASDQTENAYKQTIAKVWAKAAERVASLNVSRIVEAPAPKKVTAPKPPITLINAQQFTPIAKGTELVVKFDKTFGKNLYFNLPIQPKGQLKFETKMTDVTPNEGDICVISLPNGLANLPRNPNVPIHATFLCIAE
jgi:CRISPR/Cas system CSM-associated protein Csm5 (group 7 of RAMP superfamily)